MCLRAFGANIGQIYHTNPSTTTVSWVSWQDNIDCSTDDLLGPQLSKTST